MAGDTSPLETRHCPGCEHELDVTDTGYVYFYDCNRDECGWADGYWSIYDMSRFARVKEAQSEVGQAAAERLAGEFKNGALTHV